MWRWIIGTLLVALAGGAAALLLDPRGRRVLGMTRSLASVQTGLNGAMAPLWDGRLAKARVDPGAELRWTLVARKAERRLEVWVAGGDGPRQVHVYDVLAASGGPGPKLREGDRQVPEGIYGIESLNPNSRFHLSMKVSYPNAFDRARAAEDGRDRPGSNIFIHGGARSVGCLAIGDDAVEELFWLVATRGPQRFDVLMTPGERVPWTPPPGAPRWTVDLYRELAEAAEPFAGRR